MKGERYLHDNTIFLFAHLDGFPPKVVHNYVNYVGNPTLQQLIMYISIELLERSKVEDIDVVLLFVGGLYLNEDVYFKIC